MPAIVLISLLPVLGYRRRRYVDGVLSKSSDSSAVSSTNSAVSIASIFGITGIADITDAISIGAPRFGITRNVIPRHLLEYQREHRDNEDQQPTVCVLLQQREQEPSADNRRTDRIEQYPLPSVAFMGFHTHVGEHASECLPAVRRRNPQFEYQE